MNTFPCKNGNCISPLLECDGDDNCGDGSDENDRVCKKGILISLSTNQLQQNTKDLKVHYTQRVINMNFQKIYVLKTNSIVTTKVAFPGLKFAMDLMTVETAVMKGEIAHVKTDDFH